MRMPLGFALLLLIACGPVALSGCKGKEKTSESRATDGLAPAPAVVVPTAPPPVKPLSEDAAIMDARVPTDLGSAPLIILGAKENRIAKWSRDDTAVMLRAVFSSDTEDPAHLSMKVFSSIGQDAEQEIFSCKNLQNASSPRVELLLRGEHLHVLCIQPPSGNFKGITEARRFLFSPAKRALVESGRYGGEGIVAPDSMDLDEGHRDEALDSEEEDDL